MPTINISVSDGDIEALAALIAAAVAEKLAEVSKEIAANRTPPVERLWPEKEVAAHLGVSIYFLREGRSNGYFTVSTRTRPILYSAKDIEAARKWIVSR